MNRRGSVALEKRHCIDISSGIFIKNALLLVLFLLTACVVSGQKTVVSIPSINTSAVESETQQDSTLPHSIAILPFINTTKSEQGFEVVRRTIFNHFSSKNYHTLHWKDTDRRLKAADLYDPDKQQAATAEALASSLGVDGLLYGEITHYDKIFVGVYAQIVVGVKLRLIAKDGSEIWHGEDTVRSHAGGISTTPIGLIMDVIAASYHLRDINLFRAADELGRELIPAIPEPAALAGQTGPRIKQVIHDGVGRVLRYGDTLSIVVEGETGKKAFARIDGFKTIPLHEDEKGFYSAKYAISPKDNISKAAVIAVLTDDSGLQSEWTCPLGTLTIDTLAPKKPAQLVLEPVANGLRLSWGAAAEADIVNYEVFLSAHAQGPYQKAVETSDRSWLDTSIKTFQKHYYRVYAIDHANNRSAFAHAEAMFLPDSRLATAAVLADNLPKRVTTVVKLKADHVYRLHHEMRIEKDAVLLIEPGVRLLFDAQAGLVVLGELQSFATKEKTIIFHGGQKPLRLMGEQTVHLRGIRIEKAGIAISILAGHPIIESCQLIDSQFSAIEVSGVSSPEIHHCLIEGAQANGILISAKAKVLLHHNSFKKLSPFHVMNMSSYAVEAHDNTWVPAASATSIMGKIQYTK